MNGPIRELVRERNEVRRKYSERRLEALDLLKTIQRSLDAHAKGEITWGAVGDLGYVCERLTDIAAFIHQDEEE